MTDKEFLKKEMDSLTKEGLVRKVFNTNDIEIYALCENGFIATTYGEIHNERGHEYNSFAKLSNREFEILMEAPTLSTLQTIVTLAINRGEKRVFVFTPEMIEKLKVVKKTVEQHPEAQINRKIEAEYVKKAQEYLRNYEIEQSAPGMGGR